MPAIELEEVRKSYGKHQVLKGINLSVKEGEIFGILGPNGVGKTTLFQTIIGLLRPDGGDIFIQEHRQNYSKQIKRKISYLPSDISFYEDLTAEENLKFFAELTDEEPDIDELLSLVKLQDSRDRKVGEFSTGMKKRLGIAQSLIKDPEIIIYDEPTTGLDPQGKRQFKDIALKINRERGKTLLISSHVTTEIDSLCDRFGILKDGEVVASGTREELSGSDSSRASVLLETSDQERARELIEEFDLEHTNSEKGLELKASGEERNKLVEQLVDKGIELRKMEVEEETLEKTYLRLTGG